MTKRMLSIGIAAVAALSLAAVGCRTLVDTDDSTYASVPLRAESAAMPGGQPAPPAVFAQPGGGMVPLGAIAPADPMSGAPRQGG